MPLPIPKPLVRAAGRLGDLVGGGPLSSVALDQLEHGNISDPAAFEAAIGFRPRSMAETFAASPSHVQDRWHARLYALGPLLTMVLTLLWLGSGLSGLVGFSAARDQALALGLSSTMAGTTTVLFSLADLGIAAALVIGWRPRLTGAIQLLFVVGYTIGIGWLEPMLWLAPYGPLLKNLPVLALSAVWMALREAR